MHISQGPMLVLGHRYINQQLTAKSVNDPYKSIINAGICKALGADIYALMTRAK